MPDRPLTLKVEFTPEFKKNIQRLAKKYRNIRLDIESAIVELQKGNILGDRLSGFDSKTYIYKLRIKNSNIQKGKNAGYRLVYLLESNTIILLLTVYSKSEKEDISVNEIEEIIKNFDTIH
ncbi:MAG: type II toxin-antitoxin system RelE/ParE family toxin [Leptospiraceae bacterium]|nr:type II toxin-antitoxin system RelE/ParE family toxin [Leptospiraceae bacterium]MCP5494106.1 type II toxin-antitoxin system RelE/ParE family toxin [Leptospiraceae bacterium]